MSWLWLWILISSGATFLVTALDKYKARSGRWRVPESRLLGLAFLGGSPGLLAAMFLFRHKTSKPTFWIPAVVLAAAQAALLWTFLRR